MLSGVPKELKSEIYGTLEELVHGGPGRRIFVYSNLDPLKKDAIYYLIGMGAFEEISDGLYQLNANGWRYWEEISTPMPILWLKQNWFPATVAAATIAASVTGAVANFIS